MSVRGKITWRGIALLIALAQFTAAGCGRSDAPAPKENSAPALASNRFVKTHEHLFALGAGDVAIYDTSNLSQAPSSIHCLDCFVGAVSARGELSLVNVRVGYTYRLPERDLLSRIAFPDLVYREYADNFGNLYAAIRGIGIASYDPRSPGKPIAFRRFHDEVQSIAASSDRVAVGLAGRVEVYSIGLKKTLATVAQPSRDVQVAFGRNGSLYVLAVDLSSVAIYPPGSVFRTSSRIERVGHVNRLYVDRESNVYLYEDSVPCEDGKGAVEIIKAGESAPSLTLHGLRHVKAIVVEPHKALYEAEQGCGFNTDPWINAFRLGAPTPFIRLTGAGAIDNLFIW